MDERDLLVKYEKRKDKLEKELTEVSILLEALEVQKQTKLKDYEDAGPEEDE